MALQEATLMRWFVRGDIDGFFGLALDNLIQLLLINSLCQGVLGMDHQLVYGYILPGAALSIVIGNVFYAWQAKRLADRLGRNDVCALPYGINTPSVFVYVFAVMLPAKLAAEAALLPELLRTHGVAEASQLPAAALAQLREGAGHAAWQAGLVACLGSGVIECAGAFVADWVRKNTPRAALLSTLAGIALTFIALAFLLRAYAYPIVGLATLGVLCTAYFGRLRFRFGIPGAGETARVAAACRWVLSAHPRAG
jgi:AGZA family xanthine/uracil permease-like MFS transporter